MNVSFPHDGKPLFCLIFGFIFFSLGVLWTLTGRVWLRFHGWVYRVDEPKTFWWNVAVFFLIGLFLVGYCLRLVSGT
jgi:hypothetical protein